MAKNLASGSQGINPLDPRFANAPCPSFLGTVAFADGLRPWTTAREVLTPFVVILFFESVDNRSPPIIFL
ncbi:hypothetical protein DSLASN_00630 [Desulfoluna limicola]|uniref:Uncharacterized protein n=1 Tax=Desulfoluna limicola TaxID=2810562 RepID=A0ABN6EYW3_9BACT|nr:hypothetical protein DSLASN_00630 [Desulfoluna limicola]